MFQKGPRTSVSLRAGGTAHLPSRNALYYMNARSTRLFAWGLVAVLFVAAGLLYRHQVAGVYDFRNPVTSGSLTVGKPLADMPLVRLDGSRTSLRAFEGRPLWVNFFATWCVPCKAELPEIERRFVRYRSGGLEVLGVDQQESAIAVTSFDKHFGVTYPVTIDPGNAALSFDIHTIPLSLFVDAGGIVRIIHIGQMQPEMMDDALGAILPGR
jgi:thiol-disulfide isomerase/thioredoxin